MSTAFEAPKAVNEPNHQYARDSADRRLLTTTIDNLRSTEWHVPLGIGDGLLNPSCHGQTVCTFSKASAEHVQDAIDATQMVSEHWGRLPFADRAAVFLRAADMISSKTYRHQLVAYIMLGQGMNAWQAEIDVAELCDFLRFNVQYAGELYSQQPVSNNSTGVWKRVDYQPLEGFVYAVSPFYSTAIGGNLCAAPALLGNVVLWKPSKYTMASSAFVYKIFLEAGLAPGVIQFVPGDAAVVTKKVLEHKMLAALHFTGTEGKFREMYGQIGAGVEKNLYRSYPRIVGQTGGNNFHIVDESADMQNAVVQTVRSAFEYQGQKSGAASRLYVPASVWPDFKTRLIEETEKLTVGEPWDYRTFVGPVIGQALFNELRLVMHLARHDPRVELLTGGQTDDTTGYFVQPTIFVTKRLDHPLLSMEMPGPVLTVCVYDDISANIMGERPFSTVCEWVHTMSKYGLTGSVFAEDRASLRKAEFSLNQAVGNLYINCRSTGAVVGQQPFGGVRASGTNDKAGSIDLLKRFVNMRTIKEEFLPTDEITEPSNDAPQAGAPFNAILPNGIDL